MWSILLRASRVVASPAALPNHPTAGCLGSTPHLPGPTLCSTPPDTFQQHPSSSTSRHTRRRSSCQQHQQQPARLRQGCHRAAAAAAGAGSTGAAADCDPAGWYGSELAVCCGGCCSCAVCAKPAASGAAGSCAAGHVHALQARCECDAWCLL
jgi:hypothetical protein